MSSTIHLLTADETVAILDLARSTEEPVEVAQGKSLPVGGASADEWVAHVVRPNPGLRATFTLGAEEEAALAQGIERERRFTLADLVDENIDSGPEVRAAMGALFLRHPGNRAVMRAFTAMPSDVQSRILSTGGRKTWGNDPGRFFGAVGRSLAGLDAVVADSLAEDAPTEPKPNRAERRRAKAQ
ncbi:hypothetical protein [Methylobacterium sp. MA0201]|uniref:hypothetical protein n=1 Tax=Methylobacterium alsaeris TaxID=3344826 RepID=UPI003757A98F